MINTKRTDTERLDLLQQIKGKDDRRFICRQSTTGRGWRLHETTRELGFDSVREAIDMFLDSKGLPE